MSFKITIPNLGESISEAVIAKWLKSEGDFVRKDDPLLELETEKVSLEVNSLSEGVLAHIKRKEQDTVAVGEVVGEIDTKNLPQISQKISSENEKIDISKKEQKKSTLPDTQNKSDGSGNLKHGPAVEKLADQYNINLSKIPHKTGKDGRVSKADLLDYLESTPKNINPELLTQNQNQIEYVKLSPIRKTIAKRLKESQNTAAILTTFNEIDMHNVSQLRKNYQENFQKKYSVKLGFMSFFIKASIMALKEVESVNSELKDEYILYKKYYNIAVAVGTSNGLVVPVIKNADQLSFATLESKIIELANKAKSGKLSLQDFQNASFSITNGGVYGSLLSTPIINPPQAAILGMHNIQKRPVVINDNIEIRPMMYVALSYDHRIIDGKDAVTFLSKIKQLIENPDRLLLDL